MSGQRLVVVGCTLLLLLAAGPTATARRKGKKPARAAQPLAPPGSDDPALLMKEADQAFARQDFAAAQKILEQALALAPADAMGQFKLGALLSKGRQGRQAAVPHLTQAVELMPPLHPMRADTLGMLGRLELELGREKAPRGPQRRRLLSDGLLHAKAADALKPQPELRALAEQAQQELDTWPADKLDPLQLGDSADPNEAPLHVFTSPDLLAHLHRARSSLQTAPSPESKEYLTAVDVEELAASASPPPDVTAASAQLLRCATRNQASPSSVCICPRLNDVGTAPFCCLLCTAVNKRVRLIVSRSACR